MCIRDSQYSVAIEMCECTTHNPVVIYNKTAKLAALLMMRYNVPLRNVVPCLLYTSRCV